MMRFVMPSAGILATVASAVVITAQPAFRSSIELVQVDVSVTRDRKPVADLQASDFEIFDNGIAQKVQSATHSEVPLDVILVLDVSRSVSGERLGALVGATSHFLDLLSANDNVSLIAFSHGVKQLVATGRDPDAVRRSLQRVRGVSSSQPVVGRGE